jgi:hypothetical protein
MDGRLMWLGRRRSSIFSRVRSHETTLHILGFLAGRYSISFFSAPTCTPHMIVPHAGPVQIRVDLLHGQGFTFAQPHLHAGTCMQSQSYKPGIFIQLAKAWWPLPLRLCNGGRQWRLPKRQSQRRWYRELVSIANRFLLSAADRDRPASFLGQPKHRELSVIPTHVLYYYTHLCGVTTCTCIFDSTHRRCPRLPVHSTFQKGCLPTPSRRSLPYIKRHSLLVILAWINTRLSLGCLGSM